MIKETLCSFENDSKDSFFNAILYGFLFKLSKDNKKDKEKVEEVLGNSFFDDFQKRKKILQLDHSFDDFEKKCIANEHLVKKVYFLESMKDTINFVILLKKVYRAKIKIYKTFDLVWFKNLTVTWY